MNTKNKIDLLSLEKLSKLARLEVNKTTSQELINDLNQIIDLLIN